MCSLYIDTATCSLREWKCKKGIRRMCSLHMCSLYIKTTLCVKKFIRRVCFLCMCSLYKADAMWSFMEWKFKNRIRRMCCLYVCSMYKDDYIFVLYTKTKWSFMERKCMNGIRHLYYCICNCPPALIHTSAPALMFIQIYGPLSLGEWGLSTLISSTFFIYLYFFMFILCS